MSDAVLARGRSRTPARKSPWPWNDRAGRFSWLKAAALFGEIAPGAYLAATWATSGLGPRPVTTAIHATGLMAIRFLLISLAVTPARALFGWQKLALVRRQLGLTALFYACTHLTLYGLDQKGALLHIASEIALRFYLTIGFVTLLGLGALGVTSTDGMVRRMGRRWKQLHWLAYPLAVLAVWHYVLQSKSDVSEATLVAGIFIWLMAWRLLPAGADRAPLPVLALAPAAALATVAAEYAWFALATKVNPLRPVLMELDWQYGPHPAGQVLLLALCVGVAAALAWARQRERLRMTLAYHAGLYAGGALVVSGLLFVFGLTDAWLPETWPIGEAAGAFVLAAGVLGVARWALPALRRPLDALCALALLAPIAAGLLAP